MPMTHSRQTHQAEHVCLPIQCQSSISIDKHDDGYYLLSVRSRWDLESASAFVSLTSLTVVTHILVPDALCISPHDHERRSEGLRTVCTYENTAVSYVCMWPRDTDYYAHEAGSSLLHCGEWVRVPAGECHGWLPLACGCHHQFGRQMACRCSCRDGYDYCPLPTKMCHFNTRCCEWDCFPPAVYGHSPNNQPDIQPILRRTDLHAPTSHHRLRPSLLSITLRLASGKDLHLERTCLCAHHTLGHGDVRVSIAYAASIFCYRQTFA